MTSIGVTRLYSAAVMAVLVAVAYLSFTTPITTPVPPEQRTAYANVPVAVEAPPPVASPAEPGESLAYLRIPRFGKDWLWVVMEGTDDETLAKGPGHWIGSALPGGEGNAAIAGHRSGHGEPFADFDALRPGDLVIVAQDGAEWTYRIEFAPRKIEESESWVTQQHTRAGKPFKVPRLTLLTCWPRYGSEARLYVRAALIDATTTERSTTTSLFLETQPDRERE